MMQLFPRQFIRFTVALLMKVQLASDPHLECLLHNFPGERLMTDVQPTFCKRFMRLFHQPIFKVEFNLNNSDSVSAGTALL
jgi:hypothetical protein